jgi:hypothetical protein
VQILRLLKTDFSPDYFFCPSDIFATLLTLFCPTFARLGVTGLKRSPFHKLFIRRLDHGENGQLEFWAEFFCRKILTGNFVRKLIYRLG